MNSVWELVAAVVVGVLSAARLTRLLTQDSFPPAAWLRIKWDDLTSESSWNTLFHCHFCMAPWMVAPILLWGWLTDLQAAWWVANGWLAAAYLASIVVERDEVTD